jgi:SAM-dependent methyltransferase
MRNLLRRKEAVAETSGVSNGAHTAVLTGDGARDARAYEIASVECAGREPGLRGCNIEWPFEGARVDGGKVRLIGWALPEDAPLVQVEVRAEGELVEAALARIERPGLASAFPDLPWAAQSGFSGEIDCPRRECVLTVDAVLSSAERVAIGTIVLRPASQEAEARRLRLVEESLRSLEGRVEVLRSPVVAAGGMNTVLPPIGEVSDFLPRDFPDDLRPRAERDELPIPHPDNREGYASDDHFRYWRTGLEDHDKVLEMAGRASLAVDRFYDFGGSTGRVFRHFYCQDEGVEIWTSDFKVGSYHWNLRYMPGEIRAFLNTFYPSLPIQDKFFRLITAFSVFTHIDDLESSWLLELRRILVPGGLLYLTIHDEDFWADMPDELLQTLQRSSHGADLKRSSPFPGERAAFHFSEDSHYSCNVFHSRDYVRENWGRFFDVVDIVPQYHGKQCVVLLTYE